MENVELKGDFKPTLVRTLLSRFLSGASDLAWERQLYMGAWPTGKDWFELALQVCRFFY